MRSLIGRLLLAFGIAGLVCATAAAQRRPADVPVADFFKRPALDQVKLSPDGSRIAMLVPGPDGRNALAVADVATPGKRVGIAKFSDADILTVHWVNDRRLIMSLIDFQAPTGEQLFEGLYAVNADGSDFVFLVGRGRGFESEGHLAIRPLRWNHEFVRTLQDGSDDVIVRRFEIWRFDGNPLPTTLLRLNTATKATRELVRGPAPLGRDWVLDRAGVPRAVTSFDAKGGVRVHVREADGDAWTQVLEFDGIDPPRTAFLPVDFDFDGRMIVSAQRGDEARTAALYHWDAQRKSLAAEPFLALKGYDVEGGLLFDRPSRRLIGVRVVTDAAGVAWLDDEMRGLQDRIDQLLPGTNNVLMCDTACKQQQRYIVTAFSDRQPVAHFLFDKRKEGRDALTLIGASRPWIDASLMAVQELVRIRARDGLEMPVSITRPQGQGPWPAVLLVHGGPNVRGTRWEWEADAQFLASRGYLVIEPEFRGSTGYGDRLFRAGWKQWGLAMQDDVTDAARWAVAQGLADPKRLVIAGASYGGYAAMMGLVKDPEFYRAGINWVGVTDIGLMYTVGWSDYAGSIWQRYGMPRLVGDPVKDKDQLDATSPLKRAAEIVRPVLMAYGAEDYRVPLPHGTKMRDALKAAGKVEVEWVLYPQEGHGFLLEKNRIDFWRRVEAFLARHTR